MKAWSPVRAAPKRTWCKVCARSCRIATCSECRLRVARLRRDEKQSRRRPPGAHSWPEAASSWPEAASSWPEAVPWPEAVSWPEAAPWPTASATWPSRGRLNPSCLLSAAGSSPKRSSAAMARARIRGEGRRPARACQPAGAGVGSADTNTDDDDDGNSAGTHVRLKPTLLVADMNTGMEYMALISAWNWAESTGKMHYSLSQQLYTLM